MEGPRSALVTVICLPDNKVEETLSNKKLTQALYTVAQRAQAVEGFSPNPAVGKLLYGAAAKIPEDLLEFRLTVVDYVASGRLATAQQLDAAIEHVKKNRAYNPATFEADCGIGVIVSEAEVNVAIDEAIAQEQPQAWSKSLDNKLIGKVKTTLKWADAGLLRRLVEERLVALLGPRQEVEEVKKSKPKKETTPTTAAPKEEPAKRDKLSSCIGRELKSAENSEELLQKHLAFTGGKVFTRFPPEPNGYLHLGHAKAIRFSFSMAEESGGLCYLRFDDTNPDKENQEYIDMIKENVKWLGYTPWKITAASDYFTEMHDLAKELIRRGKAYVDKQPSADIRAQRRASEDGPYRNAPVEVNLKEFDLMTKGFYAEGEACLRMKIDMQHVNPCMRDPVAYRIKFVPHPHSGNDWCVYPTYDFEHCIVDSLENITHSLCTLEFEIRRDSYYWLLEALDLYRASVWEFGRLNLSHTVMSKRKLQTLVFEKLVSGWDDPRLPTLMGVRRRGYTAEAICEFVDLVGVARTGNENMTSIKLLEHCVRKNLDEIAVRTMAILEPVQLEIRGFDQVQEIAVPDFPKYPERGVHTVKLTSSLFIDRSDFKEKDSKDFFGLAPGKVVGLKYVPFKVRYAEAVKDLQGKVIRVVCDKVDDDVKVKGYLHWISSAEAKEVTVRLYDTLLKDEKPSSEDFVQDLNPNSLITVDSALVNSAQLAEAKPQDKFQFERVGFFVVDLDSTPEHLIFNRTVTLTEAKSKALTRQ
jgi:glutaminyl-tRNA synthetase